MYQNLPQNIDPIIVSIGPVSIHWYSVMWLLAFFTAYWVFVYRKRIGEIDYSKETIIDLILNGLIGAPIGGRLGYVLFYDLPFFLQNPLAIISPYNFQTETFTGIFGMSYHGGVIGVVIALWWTARKANIDLWKLIDDVALAAPLGYFFGRVGNFLNNELYGRITESLLGMDFGDGNLRHPSQLYEAVGEGIILFVILWILRRKECFRKPGMLAAAYLIGYGVIRFVIEFFREPDAHLSFVFLQFTLGQILSFFMILFGIILAIILKKNVPGTFSEE